VPSPQWPWRRTVYQIVHIRPDGTRRPLVGFFTKWMAAYRRAEDVALVLRLEAERGNPDAAGMIAIHEVVTDTVVHRLLIVGDEAAGQ
jgi:hypothetical protein